MSSTAAPSTFRSWMDTGTALFTRSVDQLPDAGLEAATPLPGWSRRHVIAHVGLNAEALRRLVRWARTGEPTPMYTSAGQRARDIADAVTWPGVTGCAASWPVAQHSWLTTWTSCRRTGGTPRW